MKIEFRAIAAACVAASIVCAAGGALAAPRAKAPKLKVLHDFCQEANCTDGAKPGTTLFRDPTTGTLYGTSFYGGHNNEGVQFSLTPNASRTKWKYSVIYDNCAQTGCRDGGPSEGKFIMDTQGALYGTSTAGGSHGGGNVFKLTPNAKHTKWKMSEVYAFCTQPGCADGETPAGGVSYAGAQTGALYDGVSPLYGTTYRGGTASGGDSDGGGTVFQLVKNGDSWSQVMLHQFCAEQGCLDGSILFGNPVVDSDGNVFGTTDTDGPTDGGTAFELSPSTTRAGWKFSVIHQFCLLPQCTDGSNVSDEMISDGQGNLFATGFGGANNDSGVIFKLTPDGKRTQYSVIYNFCTDPSGRCADGQQPRSGLARDSQGNLFGVTYQGGVSDGGVLYELSTTGQQQILHTFCMEGCADGGQSYAGVALGDDHTIYGSTFTGGANDQGVIYQVTLP